MSKITADHTVTVSRTEEKDGKTVRTERVTLKPGDEVPEWATDQVDEKYTRDRSDDEVPDQTRDELVKVARSNRIPVQLDWSKDQLTQAIRLHYEAANAGGSVDWDSFNQSGGSEVGDVGEPDDEALRAEYRELTGEEADGRWRKPRLKSEVAKAREAKGGTD